jgi:uncharacterized membrane protein YgdD (TMEM256/DUF423 family)
MLPAGRKQAYERPEVWGTILLMVGYLATCIGMYILVLGIAERSIPAVAAGGGTMMLAMWLWVKGVKYTPRE